MAENKLDKSVCELFAGVGGFRIGLSESGWETVFVNQWEPKASKQYAYDCYREHFGEITPYDNVDINEISPSKFPKHTLLVGGFPCQDYSVARTRAQGIQGKKGVLWWQIEKIIKAQKPPFILLENVDRLLKSPSSQRGRDFGVMLATLGRHGYIVEWRVVNAADYGFPQRRRRTFIFATHKSTKRYKELLKPSMLDLLAKEGFFATTLPVNEHPESLRGINIGAIKTEDDMLRVSNEFTFNFDNAGVFRLGDIATARVVPKPVKPQTISDILDIGVGSSFDISPKDMVKWDFMKGSKKVERTSKEGFSYVFSEGAIAFPDPLDKPARTMLTSEGKKNRSTHVIKDPESGKLRLLTPRECEKINGFPADWTKGYMPESFRYFCMGNALVVGLISIMGKRLSEVVDYENS